MTDLARLKMCEEAGGGGRIARARADRTTGEEMRSRGEHFDPLELGSGTEGLMVNSYV